MTAHRTDIVVSIEDTLALKAIADDAGITLAQAMRVAALLNELSMRQVIRICTNASKGRMR